PFNLNAVATGGANRFGIVGSHTYNVVNLLANDSNAHVWAQDATGSSLISSGITVGLTTSATSGGQAQYLKLIDTSESHAGEPNPYVNPSTANDGIPDWWKQQYFGPNVNVADPNFAHADPDGDGLTNYEEFLAGTNPSDSAS